MPDVREGRPAQTASTLHNALSMQRTSAVAQAIGLCLSLDSDAKLLSRAAAQFLCAAIERNGGNVERTASDIGAQVEDVRRWLAHPMCAGILGSGVCLAVTGVAARHT